MKLTKLNLENFRIFSNLEIIFPNSNVIVFIGNNASGKTSILDAIAICLSHFTGQVFSKVENYNIDAWFESKDVKLNNEEGSIALKFDLEIPSPNKFFTGEDISKEIKIKKHVNSPGLKYEKFPENFITQYKEIIKKGKTHSIPILAYHNVNRTWKFKLPKAESHKDYSYDEKLIAYEKTLDINYPHYLAFEEWFLKQVNIENSMKVSKKDLGFELPTLKNVRKSFRRFLAIVEPNVYSDISSISESITKADMSQDIIEHLVIQKNEAHLRFNQLSSGERMILGLVCETSRRLTIANENSDSALNGEGVVLIDEIELHLHPNWQRNIVNALEKTFPNLQFIFTTHSPLVLSGVKKECIIPLVNGSTLANDEIPDIYSGTSDEVLENIQFAKSSIDIFDDYKREIDILFNDLKFEEAELKLSELKSKVNSHPKWLEDYEFRIKFALAN